MRYPQLQFESSLPAAVEDAEIVLLLTEWPEFRALDPHVLAARVRRPVIIDARNVLDAAQWRAAGWTVRGLGTADRRMGEAVRGLSGVETPVAGG
jgi:UDPglucose 6-dehydrogenase